MVMMNSKYLFTQYLVPNQNECNVKQYGFESWPTLNFVLNNKETATYTTREMYQNSYAVLNGT